MALHAAMATAGHTDTGRIVGSVNYISPEQARGDAVGPQADVYSLGVTLFEMLTGRPPFDGNDRLAVLHKHIYDRPPLVSEFRRGLPAEMESTVDRSLEKDLSRRFASARELAAYLEACPREESQGWQRGFSPASRVRSLTRSLEVLGGRLRRHAVLLSVVVLLMAVALVVLGVLVPLATSTRTVKAPDLVGMSGPAARVQVESWGLSYREIGRHASEDVAPGSVLNQTPAPRGARAQGVLHQGGDQRGNRSGGGAQRIGDVPAHGRAASEARFADRREEARELRRARAHGLCASDLPGLRRQGGERHRGGRGGQPRSETPARHPSSPSASHPPGQTGRRETIAYRVPLEAGDRDTELKVTIELVDENGVSRTLYEGQYKPGETVPSQTVVISKPMTLQIVVDGVIRKQETLKP